MRYFSGKRLVAFTLSLVLFAAVFVCDIPSSRAGEPPSESPTAAATETAQPEPTETSTQTPAPSEEPIDTPMPTEQPTTVPLPSEEPSPTPIPLPTDDVLPELPEIELPGDIQLPESAPESAVQLEATATSGDYDYADNGDGTVTITGYHGTGGDIVIPSTLDGKTVTAIGERAFAGKDLTKVTISNAINIIGREAFLNCQALKAINSVEDNAYYTSIDGVLFNKTVTRLIFYPNGKTDASYEVPDSVETIGDGAFCSSLNLKRVTLSENTIEIEKEAFAFCTSLIIMVLPDSVITIGEGAFELCSDLMGVNIPNGLARIEASTFFGCSSLIDIEMPDSLTYIGVGSFVGCNNLESIVITDRVSNIDNQAFGYCEELEKVYFCGNAPTMGKDVFTDCSNKLALFYDKSKTGYTNPWIGFSISSCEASDIPEKDYSVHSGITEEYDYWVSHGRITIGNYKGDGSSVVIPTYIEGIPVSGINSHTFYNKNRITNVSIPSCLNKIGNSAFAGCKSLKSIDIPDGVKKIGQQTFLACSSLVSIHLPTSLKQIETDTFSECISLNEIIIPEGVSEIECCAFVRSGLKIIQIPKTVEIIGSSAFACSNRLTKAFFFGNAPIIEKKSFVSGHEGIFDGCAENFSVYFNNGSAGFINPWLGYPTKVFDKDASYTVYFNTQDGSEAQSITGGFVFSVNEPTSPARTGYRFEGWYPTPECDTSPVEFPCYITGNIIFYAKWIPNNYTISFHYGDRITSVSAAYHSTVTEPSAPSRAGYTFGGWYPTIACNTDPVSFPFSVTDDTYIFAKWYPDCSIRYVTGVSDVNTVWVSYGSAIQSPATPTNGSNRFAGWYPTQECNTAPISFPFIVKANSTFYAKWETPGPYIQNVVLSTGTLSRAFSQFYYKYAITLGENESGMTLTANRLDGATMTINGKAVSSTTVTLANGKSKTVTIKVKYGKKSNTYKFTVTRAKSSDNNLVALSTSAGTLSQPFDPNVTNYTLGLDHNTKSVMIKAVKANAMAKVSPAAKKLTLKNGQTKVIKFTVKAQSGAKKVYTVTVTRAP